MRFQKSYRVVLLFQFFLGKQIVHLAMAGTTEHRYSVQKFFAKLLLELFVMPRSWDQVVFSQRLRGAGAQLTRWSGVRFFSH
jgi:hypothetical protein